jgi:uncharacterized protein involved in exopolysaccharide biosynthesis
MNNKIFSNSKILVEDEPFSIVDLFNNFKYFLIKVLKNWKIVVTISTLGGLIGILIAVYTPKTYTAKTTFVVEDAKTGSSSILSNLVGQTGLDIGGLGGGSGLLNGDNVLQLLKSQTLIKKSLLSQYDQKNTLADIYATVNNLKAKWQSNKNINKVITFNSKNTRLEDSLLQTIISQIIEKDISISRLDKKVSIYELNITSKDEKLSFLLSNILLNKATDFYIDIKVGNIRKNIQRLETRADSLLILLDKKTYKSAEASSQLLNVNKAIPNLPSNAEIVNRNKNIQTAIYTNLIQSLELNRTSLLQHTPVFQNIDIPEFPLKINKASKLLYLLVGLSIGFILSILVVYIKKTSLD